MLRWFAVLVVLGISVQSFAAGIAIVDFQRAVTETEEGKNAQKKLDDMYSARIAEVERMAQDLKTAYEAYQGQQALLSDSEKGRREQEIIAKEQKYNATRQQYEAEMQQTYYQLLQGLDQKLRTISTAIAKEKGFDLVLDQAAVVYAGGNTVDMTDTLIARYNSQ